MSSDGDLMAPHHCTPVSRRPFCPGCGYHLAVNGAHRADCTAAWRRH